MNRLINFFFRLFAKIVRMPTSLLGWTKVIPISQVMIYVVEAEHIAKLTSDEKRAYVARKLSAWAFTQGYTVPVIVIHWLIETAVAAYNDRTMPKAA